MNKPASPADLSRRQFVRHACCAAVGGTGILSSLAQLRTMAAVAGDALPSRPATAGAVSSDYKALVCVFLAGGNDAGSMIVPTDPASYSKYASDRGDVAVSSSSVLPIAPRRYSDGRNYGFNQAASGLHSLFTQNRLAVLGNVGTLLRTTSLADYRAGTGLPPQLFSHSDQLTQWQSSVPDKPFETGWGGRLADLLDAFNTNNQISMAITLAGANFFQRGNRVQSYSVGGGGANLMQYVNEGSNTGGVTALRARGLRGILAGAPSNALAAAFGSGLLQAMDDGELLSRVLQTAPTLNTAFPRTTFASHLGMVAKMISISQALGLRRQVFFVQLLGWDMHGSQAPAYGPLLADLSNAMKAFYDATVELGVANQVTTFTASDFGRSHVPNAGGTDHGWGSQHLIMGGAVQGGDIYGRMPSLIIGADDDVGRGRWIPTTSVDEYSATLATWFGVSASNLSTVLPNIGRFAKPNLGFMV